MTLDIIFVRLTRRLNPGSITMDFHHIKFEDFYNELIQVISRIQYPGLPTREAVDRFFEEFFYINIVSNLPYLAKQDAIAAHPKTASALMHLLTRTPAVGTSAIDQQQVLEDNLLVGQQSESRRHSHSLQGLEGVQRNQILDIEQEEANSKAASYLSSALASVYPPSRADDRHIPLQMGILPGHSALSDKASNSPVNPNRIIAEMFKARHINKLIINAHSNKEAFNHQLQTTATKPKSKCDKCLTKTVECLSNFAWSIIRCFRCCGAIMFSCLLASPPGSDTEESQDIEEDPEAAIKDSEDDKRLSRKESPDWPEIVKLTVDWFQELLEEAKKILDTTTELVFNSTNIIAIASHALEVMTFSAVAFDSNVGWFQGGSAMASGSDVVLANNSYFEATFWTVFGLTVLFGAISYPALKLAKRGKLGMMDNNQKATFPNWRFMLGKVSLVLAKSLYFTIMKALLDVFSCRSVSGKWVVLRNQDMECFSDSHLPYVFCSIFSIIIYYPTATLLYPNLQYQDKTLDLKYDTTYLVIESQGKLVLSGFAAFFASELYLPLKLAAYIVVCTILTVLCLAMKPCIVKSYNIWKAGGYTASCWCCTWALINFTTGESVSCI